MDCQGPLRGNPAFVGYDGKPWDGIHMRGRLAIRHYTNSFIRLFSQIYQSSPNYPSDDYHRSCPQTQHKSRQTDNYGQDRQPEYQYQRGSHGYNNSYNYRTQTDSAGYSRYNYRTQTDSAGYSRQFNTQHYGNNVGVSNRFNNLGNF